MYVAVKVDEGEIVEALFAERNYESLMDLILKMDLRVADCGFTENLIKSLFESLKGDMDRQGALEIVSDLEEIVMKNFKEKF